MTRGNILSSRDDKNDIMKHLIEKAEKLGIKIPHITAEKINAAIKPVLRKMEKAGIRIDVAKLEKLDRKLSKKLIELKKKIEKLAGHSFNVDSPTQMAEVLFNELKLPKADLKKTKSGISTAASELKKIEKKHKIIPPILEHRELAKLISTYLKPLPTLVDEDSRLHTTYGLETSTGRLTSSEPNLQNIPIRGTYGPEIRAAFVASPGMKLISADYSQIELRVVACLAKDGAMIKAFQNNEDIHTRTASEIFDTELSKVTPEQRRAAKTVNFGIVYGQTPYGLSQGLGIPVEKAAEYIMHYFEIHKGVKNYINSMIKMARDEGYVETLFGTKRYLPEIGSSNRYLAEAEERMAINTPVQGTAAEILKLAMIELDRKLTRSVISSGRSPVERSHEISPTSPEARGRNDNPSPRMLLTVHDEIVVEAPAKLANEVAKVIKETMENAVALCVPVRADVGIGDNWAAAK